LENKILYENYESHSIEELVAKTTTGMSSKEIASLKEQVVKNLEASLWLSASLLAEHSGVQGLPEARPEGFVREVLRGMSRWVIERAN
jgi:hypothetical protein